MENLSFEEAIKELEEVVSDLEAPNLTLDESVKKFEKGMELSKHCNELLDKAEKNITILIEQSNGSIKEEAFEVPEA